MRALRYDRFGPPDTVRIVEAPRPRPAAREFVVRVEAASLNPIDWKLQSGRLRFIPLFAHPPRGVGLDFAGTIVARGSDAEAFAVGDRVFGTVSPFRRQGAVAECVVVTADMLAMMPRELDFAAAASLPIAAGTALQAIADDARVKRGERVLINGAAGGVGGYAVQIARHVGAHVTGVASTANLDYVASLGADVVIDYTASDFTTAGERYDAVFDAAAAGSFRPVRRVLSTRGVYVTTYPRTASIAAGAWARATSRQRYVAMVLRMGAPMWRRVGALAASRTIRPLVSRTVTLDDAPDALRAMRSGHGRGKIVVLMSDRVEQ